MLPEPPHFDGQTIGTLYPSRTLITLSRALPNGTKFSSFVRFKVSCVRRSVRTATSYRFEVVTFAFASRSASISIRKKSLRRCEEGPRSPYEIPPVNPSQKCTRCDEQCATRRQSIVGKISLIKSQIWYKYNTNVRRAKPANNYRL